MLTDLERRQVKDLYQKLMRDYRPENAHKRAVYEGKDRLHDFNISSPPSMRNNNSALGWCKAAIDTKVSTNRWQGWVDNDDAFSLNKVFDENDLEAEWDRLDHERRITAVAHWVVSHGDTEAGEPEILVTAESSDFIASEYDARTKRVKYAIQITEPTADKLVYGNLITDNEYVPFVVSKNEVLDDETSERVWHGAGRCPVVKVMKNVDHSGAKGHSEITEAWKNIFQAARRTFKAMEEAREFYATPFRYVLGVDEEMLTKADGSMKSAIEMSMDRFAAFPQPAGGKEDHPVTVGQFPANTPEAFVNLIKTYAETFSTYSKLPLHSLGYAPVNPETAEAIWASKKDLIDDVKMDQATLKRPLKDLAWIIVKMRDGAVGEGFANIVPNFVDPDEVALAAATDAMMKQIQQGIIRTDSEVALRKLGYTRAEIEEIRAENSAITATSLINSLRASNPTDNQQPANPSGEAVEGAEEA